MRRELLWGAVAGAAGTTALNAVTYLDMVLRARPASSTPEETVRRAEELVPLSLAEEGPKSAAAANRRAGLGALLGITTGIVTGMATGAAYGLLRTGLDRRPPLAVLALIAGLGANVGSVVPMTALGVTDPRSWSVSDWVSDLVPHLVYGVVTAAVIEGFATRGYHATKPAELWRELMTQLWRDSRLPGQLRAALAAGQNSVSSGMDRALHR